MGFDLSTAQPVSSGFDLSTATPVRSASPPIPANPATDYGGNTLQFGPLDTHIPIGQGFQNFLAGAGKATTDLARGTGQWLGLESRADVAQSRKRDAPLMGTAGGKAGVFTGTMGDLLPAAFIPGANTMAGAAALGAGSGLLQPSVSTGETAGNAALGAATGPLGLLLGRGLGALYQGAKSAIEPLFRGGQERIAARTLQSFAGGPQAAQQAATNIAANGRNVLPGVQSTTAELADNAGIAQLERQLRNNSEYLTPLTDRNQANRAAMTGAVQGIAGTPEDLAIAQKARTALSSPLYQMAGQQSVVSNPALENLMSRPSMQSAWQRAQQLAAERGENLIAGQDIPESIALPGISKGPSGPSSARDSLLQYLARHSKGVNSEEAVAQGIDPADMKSFAAHFGINRAFRKNGMSFDQAAETLHEAGYPVSDEFGRYDPNVLLDKISDELAGRKVYSLNNPTMGMQSELAASASKAPDVYSGKAIQYLKMGLNDIADTAEQKGMGAHEQNALNQTRAALNAYIGKNIPMLRAADSAFANASQPINQMQIGRKLTDKLIPALGDFGNNTRLSANNFANALRNGDQLAAQTTGLPVGLNDVLHPGQMQTVNQIGEQLARRANADELGRAVGSNTAQNLVSQNVMRQFLGPLGLPQSLGERAAQSTLGQTMLRPLQWSAQLGERGVMGHLANAALNPQEAARLLTLARSNPRIAQLIWQRQGLMGPLINTAAFGGLMGGSGDASQQ